MSDIKELDEKEVKNVAGGGGVFVDEFTFIRYVRDGIKDGAKRLYVTLKNSSLIAPEQLDKFKKMYKDKFNEELD